MKPVYILSQNLSSGGAEKAIVTLANALAEKGVNVTILVVLYGQPLVPISSSVKVKFLSTIKYSCREKKIKRHLRKIKELLAIKKVTKTIRNATVISSRNEYTTILSKYGDKSVIKIAQLHNEYTAKMKNDFINNYANINYFVQLTDEFKDEIQKLMSNTNKFTKVITIPNFMEFRERPRVQKQNNIIAVGGFNVVKGFDRLIKIWSLIANKYLDWKLVIVGDGKEYEKIKTLVALEGLNGRVFLPGFLDNEKVFELMAKSKIYAMTSYSEAFPFVLIEGMQSAMCPIAFDVRVGPRSMIKNGYNGFLIEDGNNKLYARKLEELILNDALRNVMAENAYKKSLDYVKEKVIHQWIDIL